MLYRLKYNVLHDSESDLEVFLVNTENEFLEKADPIEFLKKKREYLLAQINTINKMLKAASDMEGGQFLKVSKTKVPWSELIDTIFEDHNYLAAKDIRQALADMGHPEALDNQMRSTIYQTTKRKVNQGKLRKTDNGKYYKPENPNEKGEITESSEFSP